MPDRLRIKTYKHRLKNFFLSILNSINSDMKKLSLGRPKFYQCYSLAVAFMLLAATSNADFGLQNFDSSAIIGRWDLTISMSDKEAPSWLEVQKSGLHTLIGQFVGTGGSARPISKINFADGKVSFSIPPQWEPGSGELNFEATVNGESLSRSEERRV